MGIHTALSYGGYFDSAKGCLAGLFVCSRQHFLAEAQDCLDCPRGKAEEEGRGEHRM